MILPSNNNPFEKLAQWQQFAFEYNGAVVEKTFESMGSLFGTMMVNSNFQQPWLQGAHLLKDISQQMLDAREFMEYATISRYRKPQWNTNNEVVIDLRCFALRQFSPSIDKNKPATLLLPPFAGHDSTIVDYSAKQSLVQHLMNYGIENLYSLDYHSATKEMQYYKIDDYLAQLDVIIDDLGDHVNLIGLCQGGWFGSIYTARFPQKVRTLVIAGAPFDTKAGEGYLEETVDNASPNFFSNLVKAGRGLMDGKLMVQGFKNMNPWQHYWEKYQDLYKMVKGAENDEEGLERYVNFEVWYENTLNLPGKWYEQVIEELFRKNNFVKGNFIALGKQVNPKDIRCPMYLLAGSRDDITLPEQVFDAEKYIGTPKKDIGKDLADAGHIGLFMGRSVLAKNWKQIVDWMLGYQK